VAELDDRNSRFLLDGRLLPGAKLPDELRRRYVEYDEVPPSIFDFLDVNRR
jgi:hypothetical protein